MLENVVTPVPAKVAPDASFVVPASPVLDTSVRIPPLTVAPPNGVAVAASAAGAATAANAATTAMHDESSHGTPSRTAAAQDARGTVAL